VELLYDLNLLHLADEHLTGGWRVGSRVLSQANPDEVLARATHFELDQPNQLKISDGKPENAAEGTWLIQRDSLLNRPYVTLELPDGPTRALVTRLRRAPDGAARQLTLYFLSGMELVLESSTPEPGSTAESTFSAA
jgi:hypothetical protein